MEGILMSKELVWVSKELVEMVNNLDDGVDKSDVFKLVKEFKTEIEGYTYDIEEMAATFRRQSQKIKDSFKQVVDKEVESLQEFWEQQDEKRYEISKKVNGLHERIRSTKDDLLELKKLSESINVYGLKELIEMIDKIKYMSPNDKELLHYVFSHGKKN
jgi:methyl-accepting chemotaxis protein